MPIREDILNEVKPCSKCGSPRLEIGKDRPGVAHHGKRAMIISSAYIRCLDCGHIRKSVTNSNTSSYEYIKNIWNNEGGNNDTV